MTAQRTPRVAVVGSNSSSSCSSGGGSNSKSSSINTSVIITIKSDISVIAVVMYFVTGNN